MNDPSEGSFFRYRNWVYSLDQFMVNNHDDFKDWHGHHGDSFFSGVLIKLSDCGDAVKVATYYS